MIENDLYRKTFDRNFGLLSDEEQEILGNATVAIAGAGGGGGISAERIARLGVGGIKLADPETFEESNINRQFGCNLENIGKNKAQEVGKALQIINPDLKLEVYPEGITPSNIESFLDGADILVEEIEGYYFRIRAMLHAAARARGIYSMRSDTFGFCSPLYVFAPDGMTFEEFFDLPSVDEIPPDMIDASGIYIEKFRFGKGAPSSFSDELMAVTVKKERPFTVLSFGCTMIGTLTCSEVVRILLKKGDPIVVPKAINIDLFLREFDIIDFSEHCGRNESRN